MSFVSKAAEVCGNLAAEITWYFMCDKSATTIYEFADRVANEHKMHTSDASIVTENLF
jgi:hypothetical protein